jgi:hypothetical protein
MEENRCKEIVHEVLTGITEGVLLAREQFAESGVQIANGGKRIDIEFTLSNSVGFQLTKFSIPIVITRKKPDTKEPEIPRLPITGNTNINDVGFSGRVRNCLRRGDIKTVSDLLAIPNHEELLLIHGMGHVGLQEVEDFISRCEIDEK